MNHCSHPAWCVTAVTSSGPADCSKLVGKSHCLNATCGNAWWASIKMCEVLAKTSHVACSELKQPNAVCSNVCMRCTISTTSKLSQDWCMSATHMSMQSTQMKLVVNTYEAYAYSEPNWQFTMCACSSQQCMQAEHKLKQPVSWFWSEHHDHRS